MRIGVFFFLFAQTLRTLLLIDITVRIIDVMRNSVRTPTVIIPVIIRVLYTKSPMEVL